MSQVVVATALLSPKRPLAIDHEVRIGKDILELITGAMYVDPLTVYREYLQNSADAIDEAVRLGLLLSQSDGRVDIWLDASTRSIRIRDNGTGVSGENFIDILTAIGDSGKRQKSMRGFRGVGRLAGLGYAHELVFRSRSITDQRVTEVTWHGRRLRELLRNSDHRVGLADLIKEVVEVNSVPGTSYPNHCFEVELRGAARIRNDLLMNPDEVGGYLAQVAPVPFAKEFPFWAELDAVLEKHGIGRGLAVHINEDPNPIQRPFSSGFPLSNKLADSFSNLEIIEMPGLESGLDAIGWVLHHSYHGAISRGLRLAGLRARVGNIQIGDAAIFESLYPERRFNSWSVGEIHVLNNRIVPNGRRDDFEVNAHHQNLLGHAAQLAARLTRICRDRSILRTRLRSATRLYEQARESIEYSQNAKFHVLARVHYAALGKRKIAELQQLTERAKLSTEERALLSQKIEELERNRARGRSPKNAAASLRHLTPVKRSALLDSIEIVLETCANPELAADIVQKMIQRSRKKKSSKTTTRGVSK